MDIFIYLMRGQTWRAPRGEGRAEEPWGGGGLHAGTVLAALIMSASSWPPGTHKHTHPLINSRERGKSVPAETVAHEPFPWLQNRRGPPSPRFIYLAMRRGKKISAIQMCCETLMATAAFPLKYKRSPANSTHACVCVCVRVPFYFNAALFIVV